jgi:hypothetical protein
MTLVWRSDYNGTPGKVTLAKNPFRAINATGGDSVFDITIDGIRYRIHTFTTVGVSSFTVTDPGSGLHPAIGGQPNGIEYLIVAGGGGGGQDGGGGGGAGGLLYNLSVVSASSYTVAVGNGGPAPTPGNGYLASNGGNSSISGIATAIGGGKGGRGELGNATTGAGGDGGSGGGAGRGAPSSPGIGTVGQGKNGGNGIASGSSYAGGGGGGAKTAGSNATAGGQIWGSGGLGEVYSITGTSITYARGGNGNTSVFGPTHPTTLSNRGNGGHAGTSGGTDGRPGGSGIVIVRYAI